MSGSFLSGLLGRRSLLAATLGAPLSALARTEADEGIGPDSITLSRAVALDGPAGAKGREQEAALQACFAAVNGAGGIHGRRIVLRTANLDLRDDEAMRRLHDEHRPFALFLYGGTAGSLVAMRHASANRIPFVAPNSGADALHRPVNRYVFNVRARYQDEVVAAIRHCALVNQRRVALVHVDDAFGRDAAQGYRAGLEGTKATSVHEGRYTPDGSDLPQQVRVLAEARPQAVVCVGASQRVAELIARAREAGVAATFITLSNNASTGFARQLGEHARGVVVSQVTPPPASGSTVLCRELGRLLAQRHDAEISYAAMEAYVSAKVLLEGLRRAGPNLSREGCVRALESLQRVDLGGMEVGYSPGTRTGSRYVELTILTEAGRYLR